MKQKMKILEILAKVNDILIRKFFVYTLYNNITTDKLYGNYC